LRAALIRTADTSEEVGLAFHCEAIPGDRPWVEHPPERMRLWWWVCAGACLTPGCAHCGHLRRTARVAGLEFRLGEPVAGWRKPAGEGGPKAGNGLKWSCENPVGSAPGSLSAGFCRRR